MKIKIIATGSSRWERFIRRWGVSFLIGEDMLFDTFGDARILLKNIRHFNIDAVKIKHIVLSHDDWDHISGLWYLIRNRNDITVYICAGFKQEVKDKIASFGGKLIEVAGKTQIRDDVYSTGELYGESKGEKIFEQSVVIRTVNGLSVICGCAHPGIVNIVRHIKESYYENIHSLIGGFHLKDNTNENNFDIIKNLKELGVRKIVPMHCSGRQATKVMREVFGKEYLHLREGDSIEL